MTLDSEPVEIKIFDRQTVDSLINEFRQDTRGQNFGHFIGQEVYDTFTARIPAGGLNIDTVGSWTKEIADGIISERRNQGKPIGCLTEFQEDLRRFLQEKMYELGR